MAKRGREYRDLGYQAQNWFFRWGPERCRVAERMVARSGGNWEKLWASQSMRGKSPVLRGGGAGAGAGAAGRACPPFPRPLLRRRLFPPVDPGVPDPPPPPVTGGRGAPPWSSPPGWPFPAADPRASTLCTIGSLPEMHHKGLPGGG